MANAMRLETMEGIKARAHKPEPGEKLTVRQQRFIDEYLRHQNAARAAIAAGYSERTAKEMGSENLAKPHIKKRIDEALEIRRQGFSWRADEILQEIREIARDKRNRPRDRLKAYELVGKHLGMFRDVVHHTGAVASIDLSGFSVEDLRQLIELQAPPAGAIEIPATLIEEEPEEPDQ